MTAPAEATMVLLEVGNTTIKLAVVENDVLTDVERYDALTPALSRIGAVDGPVLCAPVGRALSQRVAEALADHAQLTLVTNETVGGFVAGTYDTPDTLGIDRVLNLMGAEGDAIVVSCGTAITVDAVMAGVPSWGAIMPGFRCAAEGLHERIPALPLVDPGAAPALPARTSHASVTNGVLLGTARAAQALAHELADAIGRTDLPVVLTGGDAPVMARLWDHAAPAVVDDRLLFRGMLRWGRENDVR